MITIKLAISNINFKYISFIASKVVTNGNSITSNVIPNRTTFSCNHPYANIIYQTIHSNEFKCTIRKKTLQKGQTTLKGTIGITLVG